MCGPTRGATLNLMQREKDKIWEKTEKVGSVVLDPETKMLWDEDMRAHTLGIDQLTEEGKASLEGQTFFGMGEQLMSHKFRFVFPKFIIFYGLGTIEVLQNDEGDDCDQPGRQSHGGHGA